jgi:rare lipoprotein A
VEIPLNKAAVTAGFSKNRYPETGDLMTMSAFCRCTETTRLLLLSTGLVMLAGLSGCYNAPEELPPPPPAVVAAPPVQPVSLPPAPTPKREFASWYGTGFNGHITSTGERYNENAMTAASKTLPIGSHVVVTNPENGRSVEVRINDRGPHVRGRTMDLSKRAAQKLGITKKGVAKVEVTPPRPKTADPTAPVAPVPASATKAEESHI